MTIFIQQASDVPEDSHSQVQKCLRMVLKEVYIKNQRFSFAKIIFC